MAEDLLPPNATAFERAADSVEGRLLDIPLLQRDLWDVDLCPPKWLPFLAYAWSVDEWDSGWTDERQREVIRAAPEIHRRKGTIGALRRAINALGVGVTLEEWFEYDGPPYCFRLTIDLDVDAVSESDLERVVRTALRTKNTRSHLQNITGRITRIFTAPYLAAVPLIQAAVTVLPFVDSAQQVDGPVFTGAWPLNGSATVTVYPQS